MSHAPRFSLCRDCVGLKLGHFTVEGRSAAGRKIHPIWTEAATGTDVVSEFQSLDGSRSASDFDKRGSKFVHVGTPIFPRFDREGFRIYAVSKGVRKAPLSSFVAIVGVPATAFLLAVGILVFPTVAWIAVAAVAGAGFGFAYQIGGGLTSNVRQRIWVGFISGPLTLAGGMLARIRSTFTPRCSAHRCSWLNVHRCHSRFDRSRGARKDLRRAARVERRMVRVAVVKTLEITPGFFESRARKSARNAIIRNLIILTLPLAAIALWISIRVSGEPIEPFILCIELAVLAFVAWRCASQSAACAIRSNIRR